MGSILTADYLEWKKEYNINNEQIDSEHQKLFEITRKANSIDKMSNPQQQKEYLRNITMELYRYIKQHFDNEEKYMEHHRYPKTSEHQALHEALLDQVNFIIINLNMSDTKTAQSKLYYFVRKIFVDHILNADLDIARFIHEKEA